MEKIVGGLIICLKIHQGMSVERSEAAEYFSEEEGICKACAHVESCRSVIKAREEQMRLLLAARDKAGNKE